MRRGLDSRRTRGPGGHTLSGRIEYFERDGFFIHHKLFAIPARGVVSAALVRPHIGGQRLRRREERGGHTNLQLLDYTLYTITRQSKPHRSSIER